MRNRPARGATENAVSGRFALPVRDTDGDWLDWRETVDGAEPVLRTSVTIEQPRTIIARNASPDMPFDRSINPYRGCEHGLRLLTMWRWTPYRLDHSLRGSSCAIAIVFASRFSMSIT